MSADDSLKLASLYEAEVGVGEHGNLKKVVEVPITRNKEILRGHRFLRGRGERQYRDRGHSVDSGATKPEAGKEDSEYGGLIRHRDGGERFSLRSAC